LQTICVDNQLSVLLRLADGLQYSLSEFIDLVQQRYALERAASSAEWSVGASRGLVRALFRIHNICY